MKTGFSPVTMMLMRQRVFLLIGITILVFAVFYWTVTSRSQLHPALKLVGLCPDNDIIDKDVLLDSLLQLQTILKRENDSYAAWQQTNKLIAFVNGKDDGIDEFTELPFEENIMKLNRDGYNSTVIQQLEVCPEEWIGPKVDHPFFFTSWRILNCSNVLPFDKVLTIILYNSPNSEQSCPLQFQNVLSGLKSLYPKVPVLVTGISEECVTSNGSPQVTLVNVAKDSKPGRAWNKLIEKVSTPYVLVGRDLDDFLWTANLERQVRMISYYSGISVAGGAVRNSTGHWRIGCLQTTMSNYVLEYQEGYYTSKNSCLFCDHLTGPFVVRTKIVRRIKFDESLPTHILFEDWFWRLKQDSFKVVNCPDVMYSASDPAAATKAGSRMPWMPLARKWGLNRVVTPRRRTFSYTCSEAGLSCSGISSLTNSYLMPICCVEQFAKAIGVFNDFCHSHNLRYELEAGSVLGVVKMYDMMPWDLDGDISFYAANMSFFKSHSTHFRKYGIVLKEFQDKGKQRGYFSINTPDLYSEMWGEPVLSHDLPLGKPFRSIPTKVELHGHWVYAPHSPGMYARNRYGIEIFRHAQSWSQLGMSSSWVPYKSGRFKRCKKPKHHACLDHFSADGNIQFQTPN